MRKILDIKAIEVFDFDANRIINQVPKFILKDSLGFCSLNIAVVIEFCSLNKAMFALFSKVCSNHEISKKELQKMSKLLEQI